MNYVAEYYCKSIHSLSHKEFEASNIEEAWEIAGGEESDAEVLVNVMVSG